MDELVDPEASTEDATCRRCAVAARVDLAISRAKVTHITVVSRYVRAGLGGLVEEARAFLTRSDSVILRGEGHSRDDAIVDALRQGGVEL